MARTNLHQGYQTLHYAMDMALLGLTPLNADIDFSFDIQSLDQHIARMNGMSFPFNEEFADRDIKNRAHKLAEQGYLESLERPTYTVIAKSGSNLVAVQVPKGEYLDYEKANLDYISESHRKLEELLKKSRQDSSNE